MPDVVGIFGHNHMAGRIFIISWIRDSLFFEYSPNGRRPQVQTRPAEGVSHSDLSHGGAKGFKSLNNVANEVWIPVDRPGQLKQCGLSALIEAGRPGSNGRLRDPEGASSLLQRPAPGGA